MHARDEQPVEGLAAETGETTPGGEGTGEPMKRGRGRPPKKNLGEGQSSSKGRKGKGQGRGDGGRGGGGGGGGGGSGGAQGNPGADYNGRSLITHLISVEAGQDVGSSIIQFTQAKPRLVCIISATGVINKVGLRQQVGSVIEHDGRFEILSLSGCFIPLGVINNNHAWAGGISVSLGNCGDQVFGGPIGGSMTAETPVHVVLGEFLADDPRVGAPNTTPPPPPAPVATFLAPAPAPVVPSPAPAPAPAAPSRGPSTAAPSSAVPALGSLVAGPASVPFDVGFVTS